MLFLLRAGYSLLLKSLGNPYVMVNFIVTVDIGIRLPVGDKAKLPVLNWQSAICGPERLQTFAPFFLRRCRPLKGVIIGMCFVDWACVKKLFISVN